MTQGQTHANGHAKTPIAATEYPPKASLAKDIYRPFPILPESTKKAITQISSEDIAKHASSVLQKVNDALRAQDVSALKETFFPAQAYWRDLLAFTWHLRTFNDGKSIAPALLETAKLRGGEAGIVLKMIPGTAMIGPIPYLPTIECAFAFHTSTPAAKCAGRLVLLPLTSASGQEGEQKLDWKIWVLNTWVKDLDSFGEDPKHFEIPVDTTGVHDGTVETDVAIIGGGNAGIIMAASLKARGVGSLIIDKNANPGDNWALRYECLKFHIPKNSCETPYLKYPDDAPLLLTRDVLSAHMRNYVKTLNLNYRGSSTVQSTTYDNKTKLWTITLRTLEKTQTIKAKHLVQATGLSSSKPYLPNLPGKELYRGSSIHAAEFKSGTKLAAAGHKSAIVVGSANSGFDVMEDIHDAGLQTTMVARSPTWIFPWDYYCKPVDLYAKLGTEMADIATVAGPVAVGGQIVRGMYAMQASREPHRYDALAKAGFPVYDSQNGRGDLLHHLLESGGGHFNEIGEGANLIADGKVGVKGLVQPVAFTETGLKFSDGTTVNADVIVWCTGYADKDPRAITASILGGHHSSSDGTTTTTTTGNSLEDGTGKLSLTDKKIREPDVITADDVAELMDSVYGVDYEGESRGLWKRHLKVENYWLHAGGTPQHRFYGRILALQIKAELEGILPEAYRDTPVVE